MPLPTPPLHETYPGLAPPPSLLMIEAWLRQAVREPMQWLGAPELPAGIAVWYRSHLQTVQVRRAHGLDWLVLQTTFSAKPRLGAAVLPLLAHANLQMEAGRWFREARPTRLVCALEVPAHGMESTQFLKIWAQFQREVVTHGVDLTLRSRAESWLSVLARQGHFPPTPPRRRRKPRSTPTRPEVA